MPKKLTVNELLADRPMASWKIILASIITSFLYFYFIRSLVYQHISLIVGSNIAIPLSLLISIVITFVLSAMTILYIHSKTNLLVYGKPRKPPPAEERDSLLKEFDPRIRPYIKALTFFGVTIFAVLVFLQPFIQALVCNNNTACTGAIIQAILIVSAIMMVITGVLAFRKTAELRKEKVVTLFKEVIISIPVSERNVWLRIRRRAENAIKGKKWAELSTVLLVLAVLIQLLYVWLLNLSGYIFYTDYGYIFAIEVVMIFMRAFYDYELANKTKELPKELRHKILFFRPKDGNPADFIPSTNTPADVVVTFTQNLPASYGNVGLLLFYAFVFGGIFAYAYWTLGVILGTYIISILVAEYMFKRIIKHNKEVVKTNVLGQQSKYPPLDQEKLKTPDSDKM